MTPTLPGSLPGLLRVGSPVVAVVRHRTRPAVVVEVIRDGFRVALQEPSYPGERTGCVRLTGQKLSLDLTDPTGRIHALWWLGSLGIINISSHALFHSVMCGMDLSADELNTFHELCLAFRSRTNWDFS